MKQSTLNRIIANPRLPSLPSVAMEVLEFTREDSVDLREAARVIQNDQALATKVLRTVNSSYYGLSRPCSTIRQAIVYLGANTVRTLVLGFALVDTMANPDDGNHFDFVDYWRRDLFTAVAARELANIHQLCDPDEAFLGGLMQDIGMIAMHRVLGAKYVQALSQTNGDHRKLPKIERDTFEIDHAAIGAEIAKKWKFPKQFIACIRNHHSSRNAAPAHMAIVRTVELANLIPLLLTFKDADGPRRTLMRDASEWFDIPQKQLPTLLNVVIKAASELSSLFRLDIGECVDVEELLAEAEQRLVQLHSQLDRENQELRENNESLSQQNLVDGLTGAANRLHFDHALNEQFNRAARDGRCVAVIFCDLDHFKPVNDTHGHQAGDYVLVEVARRMMECIGSRGMVARYGGEEFAIIVPEGNRIAATEIAEKVRREVCAAPVALNGTSQHAEAIDVTMSLGVAAYEPALATIMTRPDQLLKVADQAVYAAKKAGRNCVRTYKNRRVHSAAA